MKSVLSLLLIAIFSIPASAQQLAKNQAQNDGISFFTGSFEEAKKAASAQNKIIFMDAFTVWCGPCKVLSNTTFKDKSVGEFFNKNFINIKVDMEKGEGPQLAMKYGVRAYPTLLFIDKNGKQVHSVLGLIPAEVLLKEGRVALALNK